MSGINIIKRGTSWQYRFDIAKVNGKRKQISKAGFRTRKEALEAGTLALAKYNQGGQSFKSTDISVADYLDLWFKEFCTMQLKYNTQLGYLNIIENHLKPAFGNYRLKVLSPTLIQEFVNSLKLKGFSKSSVGGILSTLNCALRYAIEPLQYIQNNPCVHVLLPKYTQEPDKKRYVINEEQFNKIIKRFPEGSPWHIPLLIGYHTGLRIGEVFALTWEDIDFENSTLTVNKQVIKRNYGVSPLKVLKEKGKKEEKSGWYFGSTKTYSSKRIIRLDSLVLEALRREKERQFLASEEYGEHYILIHRKEEIDEKGDKIYRLVELEKGIPVFLPTVNMICVKANGEYASSDGFKYCARVIHHELKIAFNFHSLRHTHATILVQEGANIKDVQERLGHAHIDTTLDTYTHNTKEMKEESISLFEQHLRAYVYKTCTNTSPIDDVEEVSY